MHVLISMALWYSLMLGSVVPPTLFFFLKIAKALWGLLWLHIKFWNVCSRSVRNATGILIGIVF